ncbi:O-antigen ligase family protein [Pseudothauera nasutitermitis]|uniref:O-antigen ligase family protein n=1 Tax=Pseudothauera nasutitermitis TaxID=2565930 RepID=A0A4S4ATP4_9RHOO|nr:O-antigen ligase family protein [Pseudothauera nasutitermitis]THF63110.1 O-antigen ligase family protein [Pseudothauera nasutitermitis]
MIDQKKIQIVLGAWLSIGLFTLLTGLFWLPDRSLYPKTFYALFALPALIGALTARKEILDSMRHPAAVFFLALIIWVLISLSWSEGDQSSLSLAKRPVYVLLAVIGIIYLFRVHAVISLQKIILISAAVVSFFIILTSHEFIETFKPGSRYIGPGSLMHPLLTSHVLGFLFTASLVSLLLSDVRQRTIFWISLICCPLLLWGLFMTGSRTPLVGIAAVLCWLCVIRPSTRTVGMVAVMALLALIAYLAQPDIFTSRGVSWRPEIWSAAVQKIMDHPLIGHGFAGNIDFTVEAMHRSWRDPHNISLAVALELGMIGLAIWIAMHAAALYACFKQRAIPQAVLASCLLVFGLAAGLTEGGNFLSRPNESWFIIWLPLAFCMAAVSPRIGHAASRDKQYP